MFKYFLVSSQVHQEKNAMSEAAWILSKYVDIEFFKAKLLPVGGLGLLTLETGIEIPESINKYITTLLAGENLFYCFKITPLEYFEIFDEDLVYIWVGSNKNRLLENETWKVNLNKRHTLLKTRDIVNQIAKLISNPVNLKNPIKLLQVEIIGKFVGLAILKPFQLVQLSHLITLQQNESPQEDVDNESGDF